MVQRLVGLNLKVLRRIRRKFLLIVQAGKGKARSSRVPNGLPSGNSHSKCPPTAVG